MDLQGDVELLTLLRGLEEQRMTEAVAGQAQGVATLGSQSQRAEGDAKRVGVDGSEPEAGAVGTDGFHPHGATLDAVPQRSPGGGKPLARVVRRLHQGL